jgi:Flp pilus assembly pilin Flp
MKTMLRLWNEETGAIVSAEIMLVASILVIGVIVGLKSVRDSVVTELGDVAQALSNVNQSFFYSGISGHHGFTGGGVFTDRADFCDTDTATDTGNSKCISVCTANQADAGTGLAAAGGLSEN